MSKFQFKKRYGQNFLQSEEIINKIVESIHPKKDDLIIEVGPGAGAITKKLKNFDSKLIAFEIDTDTKKYLEPLKDDKTEIFYQDFLEANINELLKNEEYNNLYIVGNLPYYITTPIIEKIIDAHLEPEEITIMVQKEVAERFLATPKNKEYGYMTVLLNYHFNVEKVVDVHRSLFYPTPNVDSTVIKFRKKEKTLVNYNKFKKLLKDSFQFKRKTIANNLKSYNLEIIEQILLKNGFSMTSRAEEIDLNTFIQITNNI